MQLEFNLHLIAGIYSNYIIEMDFTMT